MRTIESSLALENVGANLGQSGLGKWADGAIAANGCIYAIPDCAARVLKFDPSNNSSCLIGDDFGAQDCKFYGAVLSSNGNVVYGVPCNFNQFLKINTENDTTSLIGNSLATSSMGFNSYMSGATAKDGRIYCMPFDATHILCLDPVTEETFFVGQDLTSSSSKYSSTVLGEDGCLYGMPSTYLTQVVKYDVDKNITTFIDCGKCSTGGGVLAPNGNIYGMPYHDSHILCLNVKEQTTSFVGTPFPGHSRWEGGTVGEDGCIYFVPYFSSNVLKFDPIDHDITILQPELTQSGCKWSFSVLGHDGHIYCIPCRANHVLRINTATGVTNINRILNLKLWNNATNLLKDDTIPHDVKAEALINTNDADSALITACKNNAPIQLVKDTVVANYLALAKVDNASGLYPFMLVATFANSNLGAVYELLRFHPGLLHELFW